MKVNRLRRGFEAGDLSHWVNFLLPCCVASNPTLDPSTWVVAPTTMARSSSG